MTLLNVDATDGAPRLHGPGDLETRLATLLPALRPGDPVVILVHGFRYAPGVAGADPHALIFAQGSAPGGRSVPPWPRNLGFGDGQPGTGLCIGFGWPARGSIWQAWRGAEAAGAALAGLIRLILQHHRGPVDMIAHSLGARVCLAALGAAPPRSVGRLILLAAAEFGGTARAALASPAGQGAEVLNIVSRENDLFDALVERLLPAPQPRDRTLGAGLSAPRWLDIQIDADPVRAALCRLGYHVPAPVRRVCHRSLYLRAGLMPFYRGLLHRRKRLTLALLRDALPREPEPRWTLLRPSVAGIFRRIPVRFPDRKTATDGQASSFFGSIP